MKKIFSLFAIIFFASAIQSVAQPMPKGGNFGFGIVLGEPTGGTIKYYMDRTNAIQAHIGSSYFGQIRVGGDYLWHFNAFSSSVAGMYAGPGLALGFGQGRGYFFGKKVEDRADGDIGIGARAIIGINVIPRTVPMEFFLELGPMISLSPITYTKVEAAFGVRFYP